MKYIDKSIFRYISYLRPTLMAEISGENDIRGIAEFYPLNGGTLILTEVNNLPKTPTNIFAYHIHEGDACGKNFESTGGHFNPANSPHPTHIGDMPPLFAKDGVAYSIFFHPNASCDMLEGHVVVIHEDVDDFTSQPAGNSGRKIACGKIVRNSPLY